MSSIVEQVGADIGPGDSILVLCPSLKEEQTGVCLDLLTQTVPENLVTLSVSFTRSPDEYFKAWQQHMGVDPAQNRIINVDADARSSSPTMDSKARSSDVEVEHVSSPENLTRLGVQVSNCLDEWNNTKTEQQIAVCFHSVTALLQYVDIDQAFKFLQIVIDRCEEVDVISHYHLDPRAHDQQTIARLVKLFDIVLEYRDDVWTAR